MIPNEEVLITISHLGYVKRTSLSEYRSQNRGNAIELINKYNLDFSSQRERDHEYEKSLIKYPFEVKIKPKGFSINL